MATNPKRIYPSHELIPMCSCGRENHKMIMNSYYIAGFEAFLKKYGIDQKVETPDIDSLPICCKARCRYGSVYSIPVELGSKISSIVVREETDSLPGPLESMGLLSWAHKKGFDYDNGILTVSYNNNGIKYTE